MGSYIKDALDQYFWSITFQILQSFTCEVGKKANSILSKYVPNYIMTEANTISAKVYLFFMFSIIFKYNLFDYK